MATRARPQPVPAVSPQVRGEPLLELPRDLYIPPDALEVFLDTFEGPLDLLLYLIRKANIDILDIPMARLTEQYLEYVEVMRHKNLELAAEYLVMAAMLMEIKSRHAPAASEGGRRRRARPAGRAGAPPARVRADEGGGAEARPPAAARSRLSLGRGVDRAVARRAAAGRPRAGHRERLAEPARARATVPRTTR